MLAQPALKVLGSELGVLLPDRICIVEEGQDEANHHSYEWLGVLGSTLLGTGGPVKRVDLVFEIAFLFRSRTHGRCVNAWEKASTNDGTDHHELMQRLSTVE